MLLLLLLKPRHSGARLYFQFTRETGGLVGRCSRLLCFSLLSLANILLKWQAASRSSVLLPSVLILLGTDFACFVCCLQQPCKGHFCLPVAGVDSGLSQGEP